jgi:hypothetical protein
MIWTRCRIGIKFAASRPEPALGTWAKELQTVKSNKAEEIIPKIVFAFIVLSSF